jgi:primase-polymerase (primpol)-like protein
MLDYQFTTVRKYDGTSRTEKAIEVFNAVTGATLAISRRRPFENKAAWVARAFKSAVDNDRRERSEALARKLGVKLAA